MASSYTDIGTELMATGENAGTWGTKTNTNIQILEEAINGYVSQALTSGGTVTLTYTDGSTGDVARHAVIALTGTITGNAVVEVPANEKVWIIDNQSSGAYTVTVRVNGQTGVTWGTSDKGTKILYANGTDVVDTNIGGGVGAQDLNGEEFILDADGDTTITADTDDQIDIKIAGADDFQFTANTFTAQSGSTIAAQALTATTIVASSTVQGTTITATTAFVPDASDGAALGTSSLEFSDLFLADGAVVNFGDDQDVSLTHVADTGLLLSSGDQLQFGDAGENISGDGTDLTISGNNINLTATADVNIPSGVGLTFATAEKIESDGTDLSITVGSNGDINIGSNIGVTFGDDGEKIEGDGTDLTIASSNDLHLTATTDINVPANVGVTFGDDGEKIEGNGTDLTISSSNDLHLTATTDINIPANVGLTFGDDGEKIEGDGTNLTISSSGTTTLDSAGNITIDTGGGDVNWKKNGTSWGLFKESSGDAVFETKTNDKDFVIKGEDGGASITALTLDMSEAGAATFNDKIIATELDISGDADIDGTLEADAITINGTAIGSVYAALSGATFTGNIEIDVASGDPAIILDTQGADKYYIGVDDSDSDKFLIKTGGTVGSGNGFSVDSSGNLAGTGNLSVGNELYLASDDSLISMGANFEVAIYHDHNNGFIFRNELTTDDTPIVLTLQNKEADIAADDKIGVINFQAHAESTGTDAILVAAGIEAVSEGDFSSSNNATKLSFKTAASEAASEKMSLSSAGLLTIADDLVIKDGGTIGVSSDADAITIASNGAVTFSQTPVFPDGSIAVADLDIDGATDIGEAIVDADLFVIDNGAGGTNRKTAASRLVTYIDANSSAASVGKAIAMAIVFG
jgi:hypothetical protein